MHLSPKPRVLIVDDESAISDTLALILNLRGFEAKAVHSGEQAVDEATRWNPDVLIADVFLGGITGIDTAIRVGEIVPSCRIVLFSGQPATAELLRTAEERGHSFDIFAKPLHPTDLIDHLSRI